MMNRNANILIFKNKLRLLKGSIRHGWPAFLGLLIFVGVLFYQVIFVFSNMQKGVPFSPLHVNYAFYAIIAISFIRIYISDIPKFKVYSATLLYTFNTAVFQKLLRKKQIISLLISVFIASVIAYILQGFVVGNEFFLMLSVLAMYIGSSTLMAWIYYHEKHKVKIIISILFVCTSVIFYKRTLISVIFLLIILLALEICSWHFLKLNIPKYYERLKKLDVVEAAQSQNNIAKMYQLASENRPQYAYGIKFHYFQPSKRLALTVKSLIEIIRIQKSILILVLTMLFIGWAIIKTNILSFIPFINIPEISGMIATLSTTLALNALYQLLTDQIKAMINKRLSGLSLPFSNIQIVLAYLPIALALNLLLSILLGFIYGRLSLISIVFWIIASLAYFMQSLSCLLGSKLSKVIDVATNFILLSGVYWYLIS